MDHAALAPGQNAPARVSAPSPSDPPQVILASASPRRRKLLTQLAIPFTVLPAEVEEWHLPGETPGVYTLRLARTKAQHVARRFPEALVLGADTVVVLDQQILGKPGSPDQARHMLFSLSGRQHTVITSLALLHERRQFMRLDTVSTQVRFHPLSAAQIEQYLATPEPFDKAGAYAIQGGGAAFVETFDGCYTNVVGLPLRRTAVLLRAAGLDVPRPPARSGKNAW
ncbi:dTTP/UTP pyrophosphatase [Candidatus Entotheonellaceae bacterium PAL068K]